MTNNDKPRPLAAIVGERLRLFRQEKGLRQEDVVEVARRYGAEWGRSSIAALEAGKRDLRLEELILLGVVVHGLGGWDQPLIPNDAPFKITERAQATPREAFVGLMRLTFPSESRTSQEASSEDDDAMRLGAIETPRVSGFDKMRSTARSVIVWDRILFSLWPDRVPPGARSFSANVELLSRMAERIRWPDSGEPVDSSLIEPLAYAAWGRKITEERDARTDARGSYETKRALQSARGHVTRELIDELQATLNSHYVEIREILNELESVIDDEKALKEWVDKSYEIQSHARMDRHLASDRADRAAGIFGRRGRRRN